jgi:hypothetical protein
MKIFIKSFWFVISLAIANVLEARSVSSLCSVKTEVVDSDETKRRHSPEDLNINCDRLVNP